VSFVGKFIFSIEAGSGGFARTLDAKWAFLRLE
jgi:hypothetical protein